MKKILFFKQQFFHILNFYKKRSDPKKKYISYLDWIELVTLSNKLDDLIKIILPLN